MPDSANSRTRDAGSVVISPGLQSRAVFIAGRTPGGTPGVLPEVQYPTSSPRNDPSLLLIGVCFAQKPPRRCPEEHLGCPDGSPELSGLLSGRRKTDPENSGKASGRPEKTPETPRSPSGNARSHTEDATDDIWAPRKRTWFNQNIVWVAQGTIWLNQERHSGRPGPDPGLPRASSGCPRWRSR